jgi:four helix bundle protein
MVPKTIKQLAIELTVKLTYTCDTIKNRNVFKSQILRSCSSIGANVSEANYAQSSLDFINKLEVALKECHETEYWLEILFRTNSISEQAYINFLNQCGTIRRKLISSIKTTKQQGYQPISDNPT